MIISKRISGGSAGGPPEIIRRYAAFIAGILLILSVIFLLLPALKNLNAVGPTIAILEESGIEAGEFWYTRVEKVGEAEMLINSLDLIREKPGISSGIGRIGQ